MATILQLGAGELMKHSIRQIQALGHRVYAVDKNSTAPAFAIADGHAPIDLIDADGITDYARDIGADSILAANEAGVLAAAQASQRLGLPSLSPDVAIKALDKGLMRLAWRAANLSQPNFVIVDDVVGIPLAARKIGYPVIVKPTRNWGSRGISRVETPSDLAWSIDFAAQYKRHDAQFIIEECIDGTEMSIEGLVKDGTVSILAKADKEHQQHPRFRVTMGINYPANLPEAILQQADDLISDAAKALGLDNCAVHAEAMVSNGQVYLIETGARPGGGHIFGQIVEAVSGVCMPQALTQILLGEAVDIRPKYQRGAVYRFFAPPFGIFQAAQGVEAARQLEGVLDFGFQLSTGTVVHALENGAERPGYCVTTGASRAEAMSIADKAVSMMGYTMKAIT
ncbi:MAG: ATP-grasp domain-containing protein [Anaerolineae bacterium]|nr:ATP-grasp domain-containing protein [Anaerolineae bacterium]MDQ7034809.1 ATP-grasp domain-containing protein [Anaerolineae bacterium]